MELQTCESGVPRRCLAVLFRCNFLVSCSGTDSKRLSKTPFFDCSTPRCQSTASPKSSSYSRFAAGSFSSTRSFAGQPPSSDSLCSWRTSTATCSTRLSCTSPAKNSGKSLWEKKQPRRVLLRSLGTFRYSWGRSCSVGSFLGSKQTSLQGSVSPQSRAPSTPSSRWSFKSPAL